jgi:CheY-like chemotaxis protein
MNILIADDDRLCREHLAAILAKWPEHRVAFAADGLEAWTLLNDRRHWFDLLFLDIKMPKLDGLQLMRRIRESVMHRSARIIICTSANDRTTITQAIQLGARHYLVKPCDEATLTRKLEQLGIVQRQSSSPFPAPQLATA